MEKVLIAIPSYKRSSKMETFRLLDELNVLSKFDVRVFVYQDDPMIDDYRSIIGEYLHIIPRERISQPNLKAKRNYILEHAWQNDYRYLMMLDDDIKFIGRRYDIEAFIRDSILYFNLGNVAMTSPAITALRSVNHPIVEKDVVLHCTAMYDMIKIRNTRFPLDVKAEDNWMPIEMLRQGYSTLRLNEFVIYNEDAKRDGITNDGQSYLYENGNFNDALDELLAKFPSLTERGVIYKHNGQIKVNKEELQEWRLDLQ